MMQRALEAPALAKSPPGPTPRWSAKAFGRIWDAYAAAHPEFRVMDLAHAAGVSPAALYKWRKGPSQPDADKLLAIARVLDADFMDFFE